MDCMWDFFCEGPRPLFHFQTQDQLGRTGGFWQGGGTKPLHFELFASMYGSDIEAHLATLDLRAAVLASRYRQVSAQRPCVAFRGWQDFVLACSLGRLEFEAIVGFYGATGAERREGRWDIGRQAMYFLGRG
jgi:hypothetical protein